MIIWCPSCEVDKFELIAEPNEKGLAENKLKQLGKQKEHKTCAKCGGNLERK